MKNIDDKAVIERLKTVRRQFAGSRGKSKFAQELGLSPSTYSYYEIDRVPPIDVLVKICEVTGTDMNWLITGVEDRGLIGGPNKAVLERLDELFTNQPEMTEAVLAFIDLLCEKKGLEQKIKSGLTGLENEKSGWIPILGRTAAGMVYYWDQCMIEGGGEGVTELKKLVQDHIGREIISTANRAVAVDFEDKNTLVGLGGIKAEVVKVTGDDEEIVEFVDSVEIRNRFSDSFALYVDGDSMSPRINDGDIVVVSPTVAAKQGQVAVVQLKNQIGVTCKLLRQTGDKVHLIPINEKYDTKVVAEDEMEWALAVLCHISV